ncbi:amidohydrolase family protein [Stappia taiwanensis]|uniref:Amidohydrolase family protein n=1 Tax=Stappia taiwanensis TaxID=992267 RepID=A0A838XWQ1_9HYPH|nr:amidohydrolase family protein [Stappia taiwanensis]MBA4612916.1 amidohydrolase family protein [Stappia taiwanensis]GGF06843.1 amidohydrolase [Stappia taiwanensis]
MKIDSHHHLWSLTRGDYGWMSPELGPIYRDFAPVDLAPHLRAAGIERTVVVQAADTVAETEYLLDLAEATDWIAGVVGWIDMEAPDAVATLTRLAARPLFKGIRPMIQDLADDDWILRPALDPAFDALIELGLSFDALVLPRHLPQLSARLERHPQLACVIDHAAKPALASGDLSQWRADMTRLARETRCSCKLSGLLTEAGDHPELATVQPAAEHVLREFGPDRVMFGSDWPVLNLAADYAGWAAMVDTLLAPLSPEDRARVWGGTARAFYRL